MTTMSWDLDHTTFAGLVAAAARAPSLHNSQPWRFRLTAGAIEVLLDADRILPATDPSGRGARLSCGAAVYNLALALAVRGTPAAVAVKPDAHANDVLARLTPRPARPATPLEHRLYAAIPRRHTNRQPFADTAVPQAARARLLAEARDEGGWLDLALSGPAIDALARLAREADDILGRDEAYRAELRSWTRPDSDATDGVSTVAGGPAPHPYELLVRRDFGGPDHTTVRDYLREPLIGVLGTFGDWPADQVRAGMVLQRVLLTATDLGLACSLFSQPIDVPAVREQLRLALGRHDNPQMLVRFGYAATVSHSNRRPVGHVIQEPRSAAPTATLAERQTADSGRPRPA
jgi:nitroreductase